jgi:hypothetical protein
MSPETNAGRFSTDDSRYNEEIVQDALQTFGEIFPAYSSQTAMHGEGLDHAWTGIIAMTTDSVPFVGAIDSLPGQYICAGFNGHGEFFFCEIISWKDMLTVDRYGPDIYVRSGCRSTCAWEDLG